MQPDPMMDPVEFAGLVEAVDDLQPYQRHILRWAGLDVAKDPTDSTALIVFDRRAVLSALTPKVTFISTPSGEDTREMWQRLRREMRYQPLWLGPRPGFEVIRPQPDGLDRWEDDGGR